MALVLDAGALIAVDRQDRAVGAMLRVAQRERIPVRTSAAVTSQVWRDGARQANLARTLSGVDERPLDRPAARSVGRLLKSSRTSDPIDAHLALLVAAGDAVLTSDVPDIRLLLAARKVRANIRHVG